MLAIRCTLLRDVFEGGRPDNPREAEWPPSWMRLFSALVAHAADDGDDAVLQRLEEAEPPDILAPEVLSVRARSAYVPTNSTGETRHGTLPARTNSIRQWARVVPRSASWWYVWPDLDLAPGEQESLARLCRRVPYLGRSTSPAAVELDEEPPSTDDAAESAGLTIVMPRGRVPEELRFRPEYRVRCAFPGALQALRSAYEANARPGETAYVFEVGRTVDYGRGEPVEPGVTPGPYTDMVLFRLDGRLDGRHTARATHAFRRAVLSNANEHLPTLHGHHAGEVVQCAFLGLPDIGHPNADGHLLGLAVAIPSLPDEERAVVFDALDQEGMEVRAGALGELRLDRVRPVDSGRMPIGLRPWRWLGPSRTWLTALPMVCDRFLGRGDDPVEEIERSIRNSRLPAPVDVRVQRRPMMVGGLDLAPHDTIRRRGDRGFKPYRHVKVTFAEPVRGPVVMGSMRHYGLGLCVPVRSQEGESDG